MLFLGGISTQIFPFEHVEFVEKLSKMSCSRKTPWEIFLKVVFFSLLRNQLKGISCCSVFPDSRLLGALNPVTVVLLLIIISAQDSRTGGKKLRLRCKKKPILLCWQCCHQNTCWLLIRFEYLF